MSLLFFTATATAEVFFARDVLDAGDTGYGALMAGWMIGMALGAVSVSRRVAASALGIGSLVAIAVQGLGVGLPALWPIFGFTLISYSLGGVAHGTKNVLARTLIQERVPDAGHGRAFAAYNGLRNGAELFALLGGGVLVGLIGSRATIALAGAIPLLVALAGIAIYRLGDFVEAARPPAAAPAGE